MKQAILCYVMIISLLAAAIGCSDDLVSQKETNLETADVPAINPVNGQEPADNDTPATTAGQEKDEPEPQGVETPEVIPSETEPPENKPTTGEQTEEQNRPPSGELPEVKPPTVEPPEVKPPETEKPEVNPPIEEPPEIKPPPEEPPEVENPIVEPPETEPPTVNILAINELRTEFTNTSKRAEYIEFKVLSSGSLQGLSLHILNDVKNPFVYNFPAINVSSGEYITLHLRSIESACINELGDDLTISGGIDSCPTARDLWVTGSMKLLYKTDIVYLQNANGIIIDAVVLNESPAATWNKNQAHFTEISEMLYNAGAWKSPDGQKPTPLDAVNTSGVKSYFYSINRHEDKENTHSSKDWYVSNNNSPGQPNN